MAPLERIAYMDHNKQLVVPEWEVVQIEPKYALPEGTELAPGVIVLPRPHWLDLQSPFWVELVTKIPDPDAGPEALAALRQTLTGYSAPSDPEVQRAVEMCRKLRAMRLPLPVVTSGREVVYSYATFQTHLVGEVGVLDGHDKDAVEKSSTTTTTATAAGGGGDLSDWITAGFGLPNGCELILVSDTLELYSLGKGVPGFETLVRPSPAPPPAGATTTTTVRHTLMPLLPRSVTTHPLSTRIYISPPLTTHNTPPSQHTSVTTFYAAQGAFPRTTTSQTRPPCLLKNGILARIREPRWPFPSPTRGRGRAFTVTIRTTLWCDSSWYEALMSWPCSALSIDYQPFVTNNHLFSNATL